MSGKDFHAPPFEPKVVSSVAEAWTRPVLYVSRVTVVITKIGVPRAHPTGRRRRETVRSDTGEH